MFFYLNNVDRKSGLVHTLQVEEETLNGIVTVPRFLPHHLIHFGKPINQMMMVTVCYWKIENGGTEAVRIQKVRSFAC